MTACEVGHVAHVDRAEDEWDAENEVGTETVGVAHAVEFVRGVDWD